jgi:hypothetical protein
MPVPPTKNKDATADGIISQFDTLYNFINEITDRKQTKVFNVKLKDKLKADASVFREALQTFVTQQCATAIMPPAPPPSNETSGAINKTLKSYASILKKIELLVTKTHNDHVHTLCNTETILAHAKSTPSSPCTPSPTPLPADHHQSHTPWQTKLTWQASSELDVVISMAKVDRKATLHTKTPTKLCSLVEIALQRAEHPDLQAVSIRGT